MIAKLAIRDAFGDDRELGRFEAVGDEIADEGGDDDANQESHTHADEGLVGLVVHDEITADCPADDGGDADEVDEEHHKREGEDFPIDLEITHSNNLQELT